MLVKQKHFPKLNFLKDKKYEDKQKYQMKE